MAAAFKPRFQPPFRARAIVIDLDGTLIDTAGDLAAAANRMLVDLGRTPVDPAVIRGFIGNGVMELVRRTLRLMSEPTEQEAQRAFALFMQHYQAHLHDSSRPYPGVAETVEALRRQGRILGCITNKRDELTQPLLKALGLHHPFQLILSGDTLPQRKPDPLPLLHASRVLGIPAAEMLLVGDSRNDTEAAFGAGMPVVCVTYGYNGDQDVRELNPDAVIERFPDLLTLLA